MNTFVKAATLGVIAGMRTMSAPSTVSDYLVKKSPGGYDRFAFEWLVSPKSTILWRMLAIGEMGGDKSPRAPARIKPVPLTARAVSGGVSGAAICAAEGKPAPAGAAIGLAAALVSTFAFYYMRKAAGKKVPDRVLGVVEDAIAVGLRKVVMD